VVERDHGDRNVAAVIANSGRGDDDDDRLLRRRRLGFDGVQDRTGRVLAHCRVVDGRAERVRRELRHSADSADDYVHDSVIHNQRFGDLRRVLRVSLDDREMLGDDIGRDLARFEESGEFCRRSDNWREGFIII